MGGQQPNFKPMPQSTRLQSSPLILSPLEEAGAVGLFDLRAVAAPSTRNGGTAPMVARPQTVLHPPKPTGGETSTGGLGSDSLLRSFVPCLLPSFAAAAAGQVGRQALL